MGNEEGQNKVRERTENETHCKFLKDSPVACESLPYKIGASEEGDRCPNNPLVKHTKLYDRLDECAPVLQKIDYLEDQLKLPSPIDSQEISPGEAETIRVLSIHEKISSSVLSQGGLGGAATESSSKQSLPGSRR